MIRVFIAAEIPERLRDRLWRDVSDLRGVAARLGWTSRENLHLTLRFLGDVKEKDIDRLFPALGEAVAGLMPFALEVSGIGCFPNWRHPRVIWAGCGEGADNAVHLARTVEDACVGLGYAPESRAFRPHFTLARAARPEDARGLEAAVEPLREKSYGFMDVDAVAVFMSEFRRGRPIHSRMARLQLGRDGMR